MCIPRQERGTCAGGRALDPPETHSAATIQCCRAHLRKGVPPEPPEQPSCLKFDMPGTHFFLIKQEAAVDSCPTTIYSAADTTHCLSILAFLPKRKHPTKTVQNCQLQAYTSTAAAYSGL